MVSPAHFYRDFSNRLTHDRSDVGSVSYREICLKVADRFGLRPASKLLVGVDEMFWDFTDGSATVEFAWNVWLGLAITAKEPAAESLVRSIAEFLVEMRGPLVKRAPSQRKQTANEAFGDVQGKLKYRGDLTEPTTDEWPEV